MARKSAPETTEETAVGSVKPASTVGRRGPKNVPLDSVIRMMENKEGVKYGPDSNPKRPGSAGHARFAMYEDGMTVQQALDKGIWSADITWDLERSFIRIEGGTSSGQMPAGAEETEQAAA